MLQKSRVSLAIYAALVYFKPCSVESLSFGRLNNSHNDGDGLVSLYMTKGLDNYQCTEFMQSAFAWLLT